MNDCCPHCGQVLKKQIDILMERSWYESQIEEKAFKLWVKGINPITAIKRAKEMVKEK